MTRSVVVIGGTGLLGYHTVQELLRKGYGVTSLSLPPVPASSYFYEQNVLPTARVARLARAAGVKKFVLYGSYTAEFAELWPELGYRTRNGYPRTRLLQEEVAELEGAADMDVMTLRLPYIFGTMPGRLPLWQMFIDIVRSQPEVVAVAGGKTSAVTVTQVAQAAVGAMEQGEDQGKYPINEYDLSYLEFHQLVLEALGRDAQQAIVVPKEAVLPTMEQLDAQCVKDGIEHGIHLVDSLEFNQRDAVSEPAITKAQLGYQDDDVVAEIRQTLAYCLANESV